MIPNPEKYMSIDDPIWKDYPVAKAFFEDFIKFVNSLNSFKTHVGMQIELSTNNDEESRKRIHVLLVLTGALYKNIEVMGEFMKTPRENIDKYFSDLLGEVIE